MIGKQKGIIMSNETEFSSAKDGVGSSTIWDVTEHLHGGFAIRHRTVDTLKALRPTDRAIGVAYTIRMRRAKTATLQTDCSFYRHMTTPEGRGGCR